MNGSQLTSRQTQCSPDILIGVDQLWDFNLHRIQKLPSGFDIVKSDLGLHLCGGGWVSPKSVQETRNKKPTFIHSNSRVTSSLFSLKKSEKTFSIRTDADQIIRFPTSKPYIRQTATQIVNRVSRKSNILPKSGRIHFFPSKGVNANIKQQTTVTGKPELKTPMRIQRSRWKFRRFVGSVASASQS